MYFSNYFVVYLYVYKCKGRKVLFRANIEMAVISAGVVNRSGRVILSRQFMDISRVRIWGLLSAFPRLCDASTKKQATFLDAGSVRYVYQPIEDLFIVLITTLNSNIVEDLATLQIMVNAVSENVGKITEASLEKNVFGILFAFDEIVVCGKKESTTLEEVQKYLEMDSAEERAYIEQKQQQMEAAKRATKEVARILKEKKMMGISRGGGDPYGGFGSDSVGEGGMISGGMGASENQWNRSSPHYGPQQSYTGNGVNQSLGGSRLQAAQPASGMSLGNKGKKETRLGPNVLSKVQKEIGALSTKQSSASANPGATAASAATEFKSSGAQEESIHVKVEEKMTVELTRDGEVTHAELKGELSLHVKESHCERVKLFLTELSGRYAYKAHAKMNRLLFSEEAILAMNEGKPFPVNQVITILRWRATESLVPPVLFTCWPEIGRMTIEYELSEDYANDRVEEITVCIPLNGQALTGANPTQGISTLSSDGTTVQWIIPACTSQNRNGSIDITIGDGNQECGEVLFPILVTFSAPCSLAGVGVVKVVEVDTEMPVRFSEEVHLLAESYRVV